MLAGGLDAGYRSLLATAARIDTRVEIWRAGVRIDPFGDEGVPILTSSSPVAATLSNQVTRTCSFVVAEDRDNVLVPANFDDPTALLSPFGSEARIFMTVSGGAGVGFSFPVFRGRINDTAYTASSGLYQVNLKDRAAGVLSSNFGTPVNSDVGIGIVDQFAILVNAAISDATFGTSSFFGIPTPPFNWTNDRGAACDDLAGSVNAFWYALADGDFVMRTVPWTDPTATALPLAYTNGDGGLVADASIAASRDGIFNQWTVTGEAANADNPFYATVTDLDPTSPTYALGPFGVQGQVQELQGVSSQGQAFSLAQVNLRRSRALTQTWTFSTPCDPSLELGDVINLAVVNSWGLVRTSTQVVSALSLPITGTSLMQVTCRALTPGVNA